MAHKMAIHAQNFQRGAVAAMERHNLRKNENYSNEDVDLGRSHENLILKHPEVTQYQDARAIIEGRAVNQVRKTSVWQTEFIISSDQEFFKELPREEQNRFFEESYKYLAREFGEQNITCAVVHYDETTPHMHFDFVPMTEQNKLSRKEVMTRERLLKIQDEMPRILHEKGYDVVRGVKSAQIDEKDRPRHLDTQEYKKRLKIEITALEGHKNDLELAEQNRRERIAKIEEESKKLKNKAIQLQEKREKLAVSEQKLAAYDKDLKIKAVDYTNQVKSLKELPEGERTLTGKIAMPESDYKKLTAAAKNGIVLLTDNREMKKSIKSLLETRNKLQEENASLKEQVPTMKERMEQAQVRAENETLRKKVDSLTSQNRRLRDALQKLREMELPEKAKKMIDNVLDSFKRVLDKNAPTR